MPVRVTQEAVEVLFTDPVPPGVQFTANPILGLRLPDYSFINRAYTITLPPAPLVGESVTPDPILAKRLPDYSFVGPYFMRTANARVTQAGLEVLRTGTPNARVTQAGLEVMIRLRPVGQQRTELGQHPDPRRQFDYSWTPGSVGINESPPPPRQTGPVVGVSVTPDPILAIKLPDYSYIGRNFTRETHIRVTQSAVEVLWTGNPNLRTTQAGVEVVYRRIPPGKQRLELGQHPDPRRQFDYSFAMGIPQAIYLTPPPPPPIGVQSTALGVHPDPTKLFNYSWLSFAPQVFLNQIAPASLTASTSMTTPAGQVAASAFLASQAYGLIGVNAPATAAAIAILTATGANGVPGSALMAALTTLQATGAISASALTDAEAAINSVGFMPGVALLNAMASMTSSDDVAAIVSFIGTSGMFVVPPGVALLSSDAELSASGFAPSPMGVSVWELPPTNPNAYYYNYSFVYGRNAATLSPAAHLGGQTFQVVMVL